MNNIKGYSQRPNYILFDDGTEIEIIYGKMIITGTIFGEREFNFDEKSNFILKFSLRIRQKIKYVCIDKLCGKKKFYNIKTDRT